MNIKDVGILLTLTVSSLASNADTLSTGVLREWSWTSGSLRLHVAITEEGREDLRESLSVDSVPDEFTVVYDWEPENRWRVQVLDTRENPIRALVSSGTLISTGEEIWDARYDTETSSDPDTNERRESFRKEMWPFEFITNHVFPLSFHWEFDIADWHDFFVWTGVEDESPKDFESFVVGIRASPGVDVLVFPDEQSATPEAIREKLISSESTGNANSNLYNQRIEFFRDSNGFPSRWRADGPGERLAYERTWSDPLKGDGIASEKFACYKLLDEERILLWTSTLTKSDRYVREDLPQDAYLVIAEWDEVIEWQYGSNSTGFERVESLVSFGNVAALLGAILLGSSALGLYLLRRNKTASSRTLKRE